MKAQATCESWLASYSLSQTRLDHSKDLIRISHLVHQNKVTFLNFGPSEIIIVYNNNDTTRNDRFNIARLTSVLDKTDINKNVVTYL